MASKIKVDQIEGSSGSTITVPTGQTLTIVDGVPVASGGTGLASFAVGDILYATGATTLTKLVKPASTKFLQMTSGGTPSWANAGIIWESKSNDFTAEAGKGYYCDTSSNDIDVTLPSGTIGDTIRFLDVAGSFDTNDLTILYGSSKIQGASANLDVATERAGFALNYYNATQGWLLEDK